MASVNGHFSTAGDMKAHLQSLLDSKEHQLQQAATFGQRVLAQRMELEERIRQLQEVEADKDEDDDVDPEAADKYKELADTVVGWDNENAELSSVFSSSQRSINGLDSSAHSIPIADSPRDEPERSRTSTNTSAAAQSRRAKNAAHRADDVEFAFEIGSGLLNEVRRLQSLLGERDKAIQDMKEEKDDLENTLEGIRTALKQQEQSADKYKEENWNLEVSLQEFRQQLSDAQSSVQRLELEQKRLNKLLAVSNDTAEQYKNENSQLQTNLEELTAKHETDVALARKHAAGLARDKSDLQQAMDRLKTEQARATRKFGRFGSPATPTVDETPTEESFLTPSLYGDDVFSNAASTNRRRPEGSALGDMLDGEELSPDQSPLSRSPFLAANHPSNEIEVLKQRLSHAHRQIATLKGGLMRERLGRGKNEVVVEDEDEDGFVDVEDEDENVKPKAQSLRSRVARGRGRGARGRFGMSLADRMAAANNSPSSFDASPSRTSSVPPVEFQGADDDDMEDVLVEEDDDDDIFKDNSDATVEPPSNRTSVDGMDPVFANILRRTPSTSSIPPNTSPLHQSLLRRSTRGGVGRRPRGGMAFQDGRPPSLVGQPEDLAAALGGASPLRGGPIDMEPELEVETADFACQTESLEEEKTILPEKELVETAIQSDPEFVPSTSDMSMQTDVETPVPGPVLNDMATNTEPAVVAPVPVLVQAEVQTPRVTTQDIDTQTPIQIAEAPLGRKSSLTQQDISLWSLASTSTPRQRLASNATITRSGGTARTFLSPPNEVESDAETETGVETETDPDDYQDARQSIMFGSTPSQSRDDFHDARQSMALSSSLSASREDFHSVMTMTDNEYDIDDDDDDAESIKASHFGSVAPSPAVPHFTPAVSYDTKSIEVNILDEPPAPLPPPKPEVKEISIQTDAWTPPAPPAPVPAPIAEPPASPALYRVGTTSHLFQFIPPPPSSSPAPAKEHVSGIPVPAVVPTPSANIFRETSNGFGSLRQHRSSTDSRRSIESTMSSIYDDGPTPTNIKPVVVDKTRPPMMVLPPPPRAPPPPGSMLPPSFIPERRKQATSSSSYDVPPPRPSSPPPPDLIQRATTPTFGSVLSVPRGNGQRQHGSSMPPTQQGLRQPPSTSSFRSAANAASYAQHSMGGMSSFVREMSSTSLASDRSPRSSMSSEQHPFLNRPPPAPTTPANTSQAPPMNPTDPTIIHAITQTMIGEFLYKYTRKAIGKGYGEKRHKRFFWVHPYTKTLYWSSADPGSTNVTESSAKSAFIDGVRSVLDPNPMPPGLYQYSVVVSTPQREMKITAPTKERHDIWLNALKYLLSRPSAAAIQSPGNGVPIPDSPMSGNEFSDDGHGLRNGPLNTSPQSQRSGRSTTAWNTTPRGKRSRSQLSVGGSIGKRSGTPAAEYLRWNGMDSPYSPTKSFVDVPQGDDDDLDFELHGMSDEDEGFEGLENVRACCDGRHTVGHSGGRHHHHHHHQHSGSDGHLDVQQVPEHARPVSPSAWSFRSRSGSTTSHEGGTGIFSWGEGKLRFGSRRSAKAPTFGQ